MSNNNEAFLFIHVLGEIFSIKFYVSTMCTYMYCSGSPMKTIKDFTLSNYPLVLDVDLKQHSNVFMQKTTLATSKRLYKVLNYLVVFFRAFSCCDKVISFHVS